MSASQTTFPIAQNRSAVSRNTCLIADLFVAYDQRFTGLPPRLSIDHFRICSSTPELLWSDTNANRAGSPLASRQRQAQRVRCDP
jgi:hypothetical protein